MIPGVNIIAAVTVAALGLLAVAGFVRALRSPTPAAPALWAVDPDWAVLALRSQIKHHPTGRRGELEHSGITISAQHVVRMDAEGARGAWVLRVGTWVAELATEEELYEAAWVRLQGIAEHRAEAAQAQASAQVAK